MSEIDNDKVSTYPREITEIAEKIMKRGNPVTFMMNTFKELHVGDRNAGKMLLCSVATQSIINSAGIQPKFSGNSGKGKTDTVKAILHLIPKKWKLEGSLSDKALFYTPMLAGTILFSDDVNLSEEMIGIIKRATTNFQSETTHRTLNSQRMLETHSIPSRIVWWLTSVDDNLPVEVLNRQMGLGVDETTEQDDLVFKFQLQKELNGTLDFPITKKVLICRVIVEMIKLRLFVVKVPFANRIRWEDKINRRNFPIFMDIVKAYTVFKFMQRTTNTIDGITTIEATLDDFNDAKELYASRAENQISKLTNTELKLVRGMRTLEEYETADIQKILDVSQARVYQLLHGKDGKHGLLDKIPDMECQKVSEKDTMMDRTVSKNIYILKKAYNLETYGSVVGLDAITP